MDLQEILDLDIEKLKKEYQPRISDSTSSHRFSFGIIPQNLKTAVIDFLEQNYHRNGKYPSIRSLDTHIRTRGYRIDIPWPEYLADAELEEILLSRGLPLYDSIPSRIDSNFALAVTLICDISDKRSKAAKLKDAGLSTRQWTGFLKRPSHSKYFQERLHRIWEEEVEPNAKLAIAKGVESGDLSFVKYFHEYTGAYRPADQQIVNLQLIITGLLEILAKHLSKELLQTVASELEQTGLLQLNAAN